ncbi:MAG: beta-galactosidase [Candidatus Ruminococcus intestinipullorum]|nr:beta-galactosidase [Candidatus Ruminococcus intestinipullorum]
MKQKELVFGTAYYPEYMPYDRIDQDLNMMKKAGMNVVRIAESTWSTLEREEGIYDFSYIDCVLEKAFERKMYVIIGTPTYAIPSWLARKDADILVTTKNGRANYGHRQLINILNPVFREHAENIICRLVEHTASHPSVIGFQIDNETKHYGNDGEQMQKLFQEYLQEKYKDTDTFNKAFYLAYWSNSIHNWEDLPDMKGCVNGGLVGEYEAFKRSIAAKYLKWQAQLVGRHKRDDQFITQNFDFEWKKFGADIAQDGYSYGVQPDINHLEGAQYVDLVGTDIYHPTQDNLTGAEIAFGGDSIRSLKNENYLVLECQAQAFKYWTPYPGQLRLQAYSHLASGAMGIMYWNWHSIHNGYETYWRGLLSHDLQENPAYEEACVIGAEWKKHEQKLRGLVKNNKIALLVDNRSLTALKWYPIDRDLSYNDVVRWMYDSLYEMNLECDVVDVKALKEEKYNMIVVPALYCADEDLIQRLDVFVKNGGVLVSSFRSFVANEQASVYPDAQPHNLTECFGMTYNQFTEPGRSKLFGEELSYYMELLKPDKAESLANYEHPYWNPYAGITRNMYGEGTAFYVGCFTTKECLKKVFREAAEKAGILISSLVWPVTIRSGVTENEKNIHYILHYSENAKDIICPYEKVIDILTDVVYEKGDNIHLSDWDVVILEEL